MGGQHLNAIIWKESMDSEKQESFLKIMMLKQNMTMAILFNEIQFIKSFEYKFWTYHHNGNGHKKTPTKIKSNGLISNYNSMANCQLVEWFAAVID